MRRLILGLALCSCAHAAAPESSAPPPSPVPTGFSRVIVHSEIDTPVGLRIDPALAIGGGVPQLANAGPGSDFAKTDAFPQELLCPLRSACTVHVRNKLKVVVFAFEPTVEVTIGMPGSVRYHAVDSLSAALGDALAQAHALRAACTAKDTEQAATLEEALRETATTATHAEVRRAGGLLLMQHQCTGAQLNVGMAQGLLTEIDPTSPDLVLWTDALTMLGDVAHDEAKETALIDAVIEKHPNEHVVAHLLLGRLFATLETGDEKTRDALAARLREPRFVGTSSLTFALTILAMSDPLRVEPGESMPPLELALLDGGTLSTSSARKSPLLVYFSASWCKGCVESLPTLRKLAKENPELEIAYVLWESAASAKTYVERHAPVPGMIAHADEDARATIQKSVLKMVVLPTFVLVDAKGTVIATSKSETLDDLGAKLRPN